MHKKYHLNDGQGLFGGSLEVSFPCTALGYNLQGGQRESESEKASTSPRGVGCLCDAVKNGAPTRTKRRVKPPCWADSTCGAERFQGHRERFQGRSVKGSRVVRPEETFAVLNHALSICSWFQGKGERSCPVLGRG